MAAASLMLTGSLALGQGSARTGRITGQSDNSGLPGVNVSVKGMTRGVVINANGEYSIQAGNRVTLVYSFIGFKGKEVTVDNQYVFPSAGKSGTPAVDPAKYSLTPDTIYPITKSATTNWFDEVSQVAPIQNYQIGASGSSETGRYALSVG